jgi:hypothetical protein
MAATGRGVLILLVTLSLPTAGQAADSVDPGEAGGCPADRWAACSQDCDAPRWTATADALFLVRSSARGQRLLTDPLSEDKLLDSADLTFSTEVGPRLGLIRHGTGDWDFELNYFGIAGWNAAAEFPNSRLPVGLGSLAIDQTLSLPVTDVAFQYRSRLDSSELNLRHPINEWLTGLVGFRWVELQESYTATGTEAIFSTPLTQSISSHNHLYGGQIGVDARLSEDGRQFRIDGLARAGLYYNSADQNNEFSDPDGIGILSASATGSHTAFLGELGVMASYQFSRHIAVRGGYQVMWIEGLALAPRQIAATDFGMGEAGVNTTGGLFYHGATAGLEAIW